MINFSKLITSILISEFIGIIGSYFTVRSIPTWYSGLQKSAINPPNWVFGPVWTLLFLLMGISAYFVLDSSSKRKNRIIALVIYSVQLIFNFLWSFIFFGLKNPKFAFYELLILWILIFLNIIFFYKISKLSAYLLIPYIVWVSFAGYLNFSVWRINYPSEEKIWAEIWKANYCSTDDDCIVLDSKCPFDCSVTVNKRQRDRISNLIDGFNSRCSYGCSVVLGAVCRSGKCVLNK